MPAALAPMDEELEWPVEPSAPEEVELEPAEPEPLPWVAPEPVEERVEEPVEPVPEVDDDPPLDPPLEEPVPEVDEPVPPDVPGPVEPLVCATREMGRDATRAARVSVRMGAFMTLRMD